MVNKHYDLLRSRLINECAMCWSKRLYFLRLQPTILNSRNGEGASGCICILLWRPMCGVMCGVMCGKSAQCDVEKVRACVAKVRT